MPSERPDEKKPPVQEPPPRPEDQVTNKTIRAGEEDEPFDVPTDASIGLEPLSDLDDENHEKRRKLAEQEPRRRA